MMTAMSLILAGAAAAPPAPAVRIEQRPAFQAVVRDVQGDYSQHAVVVRDLMIAVSTACPASGTLFGIYPQDPDAVPPASLRWQIGYSVSNGAKCPSRAIAGYSVKDQRAETDAVMDSTLGASHESGLAMLAWLGTSGYAQVGPTRMEFAGMNGDPSSKVRIVVPVRRRTWPGPVLKAEKRQ